MDRTITTTDALTVAAADARPAPARHAGHHDADRGSDRARHGQHLPARARLARDARRPHVFRTLGRGLVAEFDPAA